MGRNDEALDALNRAIHLSPVDTRAIVGRGLVHLALKDHEKALTDFGKSIELDPQYAFAFHARAYAYHSMGLYRQALAAINHAIALDPDDTSAVAYRRQVSVSMRLRGDNGKQWLERFTPEARRIVVQASEEARLLGHDNIGTGHLLLGLIRENQGIVASALAPLAISLEEARDQVREMTGGDQSARPRIDSIQLTPRAKDVLVCSFNEALQLGHDSIGAGHILLALMREEQDSARILANLGGDLKKAHERLIQLLH
jgi:tetratricopeptide (TPR) repeat protein